MDTGNSTVRNTRQSLSGEIGVDVQPDRQLAVRLNAFVELFLSDQCNIRPTSVSSYRKGLRRFLSWLESTEQFSPTRETVISYKRSMEAQGLSANTLSTYLVVVRKFFEWLEGKKLYPNVARGVKGGKSQKGFRKDCLTRDQVKSLLAHLDCSSLKGKRDYALINLLIRTGLRTIEVIRANVADMRQEGGEARLFVHGKGCDDKDDYVVLTPATLNPLMQYLHARGVLDDAAPLFASLSDRNRGSRLTTRSIRRIIKESLRRISLDSNRLTAHSLRHTAVTFSVLGGASVQDAQAMARHVNINTTMAYFHNVRRFDQAGERKVDEWLDDEQTL